jgi:hypothetical protein
MKTEITWDFKYMELGEIQKGYPVYSCYTSPVADFYWKIKKGTHKRFEIRKDGGQWINHNNTSYIWNGFTEGKHKFEVRNIDTEDTPSNVLTFIFYYYIVEELTNKLLLEIDGQDIHSSLDIKNNKLFLTGAFINESDYWKKSVAIIDLNTLNVKYGLGFNNINSSGISINTMFHNIVNHNEIYTTTFSTSDESYKKIYKLDIQNERKLWEIDYTKIENASSIYNFMKFEFSSDNSTLYTGIGNKLVLINNNTGQVKQIKELPDVGDNKFKGTGKGMTGDTYCEMQNDYLYILADCHFICYNTKTNSIKWQIELKGYSRRIPFRIMGDYIYCLINDYFKSYFIKINKNDGEIIYSTTFENRQYFEYHWDTNNNFINKLFDIYDHYAIILIPTYDKKEENALYKVDINTGDILLQKDNITVAHRSHGIVVDTFGRTYLLDSGITDPSSVYYFDNNFNLIWRTTLPCISELNAMIIHNNILYVITFRLGGMSYSYNGKSTREIGRGRDTFIYTIDPYKNINKHKLNYNPRIYNLWDSLQGPKSNK